MYVLNWGKYIFFYPIRHAQTTMEAHLPNKSLNNAQQKDSCDFASTVNVIG